MHLLVLQKFVLENIFITICEMKLFGILKINIRRCIAQDLSVEALVADFTSKDLAVLVSRRVSQKVVQTCKSLTTLVTPEQQTIGILVIETLTLYKKHPVYQQCVNRSKLPVSFEPLVFCHM